MMCLTSKPSQSFFVYCIQSKKNFCRKRAFYGKGREKHWTKYKKEGFLISLARAIKMNPTIRKHSKELNVHEKTVRTAIKQDSNHNPLNYAPWSILQNNTNATSYRNIGSLKTAIAEENLKNIFRRRVDTIIEKTNKQKKNGGHIE